MGNRPLFDCRHPSLPRLLAIPARSRCAARHLSSTRGPPRPDARKTGRTESARRRKEIWLAGSGLLLGNNQEAILKFSRNSNDAIVEEAARNRATDRASLQIQQRAHE